MLFPNNSVDAAVVPSSWTLHSSILAEASLHILHIWPDAMAVSGLSLLRARTLVATRCSTDGKIFYEQSVTLSGPPFSAYLRMIFGEPLPWPVPSKSSHPMHVFVVRSSTERLSTCASILTDIFHESASLAGRRPSKSVCGATETHSEAIVASQMLFNNNSLAVLRHGGAGPTTTCEKVAARLAADMFLAGVPPPRVKHARSVETPGAFLFPDGFLLDTGAVSVLLLVPCLTLL